MTKLQAIKITFLTVAFLSLAYVARFETFNTGVAIALICTGVHWMLDMAKFFK